MATPVKGGARRKVAKEALVADKDPSKPGEGGAVGAADELDMAAPVLMGDMPFEPVGSKVVVKPEEADLGGLAWDGHGEGTLAGGLAALEFLGSGQALVRKHGLSERAFMVYLGRKLPAGSPPATMLQDDADWAEFFRGVQARYMSCLTPATLSGHFASLRQGPGETGSEFVQRARRLGRHLLPLGVMSKEAMASMVCTNFSNEWVRRNRAAVEPLYTCRSLEELERTLGMMIARRAVDDTVLQQSSARVAEAKGASTRGRKEKVIRCYKCKEEGLIQAECPKRKANVSLIRLLATHISRGNKRIFESQCT
jgi:hypothetical protein